MSILLALHTLDDGVSVGPRRFHLHYFVLQCCNFIDVFIVGCRFKVNEE